MKWALLALTTLACGKQASPETSPHSEAIPPLPSSGAANNAVAPNRVDDSDGAGPGAPRSAVASASPVAASSSSATWCGVAGSVTAKQLGPNDFEMSRAELQRIVQSVDTYARSGIKLARLVPSLAKDGREGVRVFGIGPNANCGLVLGDLVLAIDGVRVNDSALEQRRDELPGAKRVVLQLERHGEPLSLTYHIR